MPKSSQAARNSCLSAARSSASRRRQAGSILKKLNLAKVRSAIGVTIALGLALAAPATAAAGVATGYAISPEKLGAVLFWLPPNATVAELADSGLSPGVMSAGLGAVPKAQTYLDVGQGSRV